MLRLMKYFDYSEKQKGLLLGIVEGAILGVAGRNAKEFYQSQRKLLDFLLYNKSIELHYVEGMELDSLNYELSLDEQDEDLYNINAKSRKKDVWYLHPGAIAMPMDGEEGTDQDERSETDGDRTMTNGGTKTGKPRTIPDKAHGKTNAENDKLEVWGYELIDKNGEEMQGKLCYAFESSKGNIFDFCQNIPGGNCQFCDTFKGFYSVDSEELMFQAEELYVRHNVEPHPFTNHTEFACIDLFFGVFLSTPKKFFIDSILGFVNRMLLSKTIDEKVKCGWSLYYLH